MDEGREVLEQRVTAAPHPQVELLGQVVVVVVRRVVGDAVLDAGTRRAGVAATEGDAVHQVLAVHVALEAAVGARGGMGGRGSDGRSVSP